MTWPTWPLALAYRCSSGARASFRYTCRKFRDALREHYPAESEILFANKPNNGLAYRHIMNQESAGGDWFGVNEMYLSLLAGTDPKTLILNGSNKSTEKTGDGSGQRALHQHRRYLTSSTGSTKCANGWVGSRQPYRSGT